MRKRLRSIWLNRIAIYHKRVKLRTYGAQRDRPSSVTLTNIEQPLEPLRYPLIARIASLDQKLHNCRRVVWRVLSAVNTSEITLVRLMRKEVFSCLPHGRMIARHSEFLDQLTNHAVRFELIVVIRRAQVGAASAAVRPRAVILLFPNQPPHLIQLPQRRYGWHCFA